jgi:hypothetical protein
MDTESSGTKESPQEDSAPGKTGRPPSILITATTNQLQLQKFVKYMVKENFQFRNTRNGTRVITKTLANFAAVKSYLETHNLQYFTSLLSLLSSILFTEERPTPERRERRDGSRACG